MLLKHALFLAFVMAFTLTIVLTSWLDRFHIRFSLPGVFLAFLGILMAAFLLLLYVPGAGTPVIILWLILVAVSLLANLIS